MSPEEVERIKSMPETSQADARLIFIRRQGLNDYQQRIFDTSEIGKDIPKQPLKNLKREEILSYINLLESSVREMKAYAQGVLKGFEIEVEPEIRDKQEREKVARETKKKETKKSEKSVDAILSGLGISAEEFMAALTNMAQKK